MSQQPPGASPASPAPMPPAAAPQAPMRPPLDRRARRGARVAGGASFFVLALGWSLLLTALVLGLLGGVFVWIAGMIRQGAGNISDRRFAALVESIDIGAWVPLVVLGGVVGLLLMVLALFLSRWILGAHGVHRAWGVTWAATGIAIVASWIIGGLVGIVLQFLPLALSSLDWKAALVVSASVSTLLGIAVTVVIGVFAWWWMAHALRARDAPALAPGTDSR